MPAELVKRPLFCMSVSAEVFHILPVLAQIKLPPQDGKEYLRCQNDQNLRLLAGPQHSVSEKFGHHNLPPLFHRGWLLSSSQPQPIIKVQHLEFTPESFCSQQQTRRSLSRWPLPAVDPLSHWSQFFIPFMAGCQLGSIHYLQHARFGNPLAQQFSFPDVLPLAVTAATQCTGAPGQGIDVGVLGPRPMLYKQLKGLQLLKLALHLIIRFLELHQSPECCMICPDSERDITQIVLEGPCRCHNC